MEIWGAFFFVCLMVGILLIAGGYSGVFADEPLTERTTLPDDETRISGV